MESTGGKEQLGGGKEGEAEIIRQIIENAEELDLKDLEERESILRYGGKKLELYVSTYLASIRNEARSFIINIAGSEHKINETTLLYKAARQILQNIADETQRPIIYCLVTSSGRMADWAFLKGGSIFNWAEKSSWTRDDVTFYSFEARILPTIEQNSTIPK